jgi:hypothetical protein
MLPGFLAAGVFSAGGGIIGGTASESIILADSAGSAVVFAISTAESITPAATTDAALAAVGAIAESVSLSDTASAISGAISAVGESVTLSDAAGATISTADTMAESVTLADTEDDSIIHSTIRQIAIISPAFGLISLNSGATVRQTGLPGVAVNEGT